MSQKEKEGVLFSAEEMTNAIPHSLEFQEDKPETIFGMTFKNAEERRNYFREELRKKLPELKNIEGYPIGSDEDILNLSDPPYYTACPNPWLNQFIEEWEKEKTVLEKEGKRRKDFEVKEPYAADVSEGKNNPVYTAHTYHTKVPHPAIMRYILHYTQPGDIVFDGFAGTGMTGVAAAACANDKDNIAERINSEWIKQFGHKPNWGARHAICGDLSPYATNIAYFYNTPADINALKKEVERIKKEMDEECGWMYTTTDSKGNPRAKISFVVWSDIMVCPNCGQEYVFWNQAVDHENKCMRDEFICPHCGTKQSKKTASLAMESYYDEGLGKTLQRVKQKPVIIVAKAGKEKIQREPNEYDLEVLDKIDNVRLDSWYPIIELPEGQETRRNLDRGIAYVHQFYTKRNLAALSKLYAKIEKSGMSSSLRFLFTGMLILSSNMNRVRVSNFYNRGKGNLSGTLYVPALPVETSILDQILERFHTMEKASALLSKTRSNAQYVASADNLLIANDSIDYIFVDPPFGANLNYSELNSVTEAWLRVVTNNAHEAIDNKAQGKNTSFYREMITCCFAEYARILKPGKYMTVEFSNTSAAIWNSIQVAIQNVGLVISTVSALDKQQGSFKAVTTTTAVKQDLVITCYKPSIVKVEKIKTAMIFTANVWDFIVEHLLHLPVIIDKNNKTTSVIERSPKILYDRMISFFVQQGLPVPLDAKEFQQGLLERFVERDGLFFTAEQAVEYEIKKKSSPEFVPMGILVDDEANGIQWLKNLLLDKPKTYQEIQPEWILAINSVRKHDILPELKQLLEENFIEMEDGKWRLPNIQDDVDKEALRTKSLLREFKIYVEQAQKPKGKIKEARVEALRAGFKDCYIHKDFMTIVMVGNKIPQNLRDEDKVLFQFYDNASNKIE